MHTCPQDEGFSASDNGALQSSARAGGAADLPHDAAARLAVAQARRSLAFMAASRDCFPAIRELADHPGWEMMLHLFIAGHEDQPMDIAALCALTGTWRPLAVRYMEMLMEHGLIERIEADAAPDDWPLTLSDEARARMQTLLCGFAYAPDMPEEAMPRD